MYFYPYAAPLPSTLAWAGDAVGVALLIAGLVAVAAIGVCSLRAKHQRVVRTVPMISVSSGHSNPLPRAAA